MQLERLIDRKGNLPGKPLLNGAAFFSLKTTLL